MRNHGEHTSARSLHWAWKCYFERAVDTSTVFVSFGAFRRSCRSPCILSLFLSVASCIDSFQVLWGPRSARVRRTNLPLSSSVRWLTRHPWERAGQSGTKSSKTISVSGLLAAGVERGKQSGSKKANTQKSTILIGMGHQQRHLCICCTVHSLTNFVSQSARSVGRQSPYLAARGRASQHIAPRKSDFSSACRCAVGLQMPGAFCACAARPTICKLRSQRHSRKRVC